MDRKFGCRHEKMVENHCYIVCLQWRHRGKLQLTRKSINACPVHYLTFSIVCDICAYKIKYWGWPALFPCLPQLRPCRV